MLGIQDRDLLNNRLRSGTPSLFNQMMSDGYAYFSEVLAQRVGLLEDINYLKSTIDHTSNLALIAAQKGCEKLLAALIKAGLKVNLKNIKGDTALILAAKNGHIDCVRTLIEAGADLALKDKRGKTALTFVIKGGHTACASKLRLVLPQTLTQFDKDEVKRLIKNGDFQGNSFVDRLKRNFEENSAYYSNNQKTVSLWLIGVANDPEKLIPRLSYLTIEKKGLLDDGDPKFKRLISYLKSNIPEPNLDVSKKVSAFLEAKGRQFLKEGDSLRKLMGLSYLSQSKKFNLQPKSFEKAMDENKAIESEIVKNVRITIKEIFNAYRTRPFAFFRNTQDTLIKKNGKYFG